MIGASLADHGCGVSGLARFFVLVQLAEGALTESIGWNARSFSRAHRSRNVSYGSSTFQKEDNQNGRTEDA
jgi:hypothetical protein